MALVNEHIFALAADGPKAWNVWAEDRLAEKRALIQHGQWEAEHDYSQGLRVGKNKETQDWLDGATVSSSGKFPRDARFDECIFPGPVIFRGARVYSTPFKDARFEDLVRFDSAHFEDVSFEGG